MSHWHLGSSLDPSRNNIRDAEIDLIVDDSNGHITGTLAFLGHTFTVTGNSAASGSVTGRNASAFSFSGTCEDAPATTYIAASGTLRGAFALPTQIDINIVRASSANGQQYGWDGTLVQVI